MQKNIINHSFLHDPKIATMLGGGGSKSTESKDSQALPHVKKQISYLAVYEHP